MLHFKGQWILRGAQSLHPVPVQSASGVQVSHVTTNVQVYTSGVQVSHVTTNVQVYTSGSTMTFHMVVSGTTTTVSSVHFRFQFEGIKDTLPVSIFWFNITGTVVDCGCLHRAGLFEVTIEKTINCFYWCI